MRKLSFALYNIKILLCNNVKIAYFVLIKIKINIGCIGHF